MAFSSSRSNDSMVGLASSAAKIVVTSALLAGHRQRRKCSRIGRSGDDPSLVAIDEGHEVVNFEDTNKKLNTTPPEIQTRSRSPSPESSSSNGSMPIREIVVDESRSESPTERDLNDAILQVRARRRSTTSTPRTTPVCYMSDSETTHTTAISAVSATGPEHVEFYLPQLGKDKHGNLLVNHDSDNDPTLLENILRPWQVEFLESLGITTAKQFLKTKKRRNLARDMKRWRKSKGLLHIKSKSCKVALHIWAHTCEAVLRDVEEQRSSGKKHLSKPGFLQRTLSSESLTATTVCSSDGSVNRTLVY